MDNNFDLRDTRISHLSKGLKETDYVYKFLKLKYLKILLKTDILRIDCTSTWEDSYENFLLKEPLFLKDCLDDLFSINYKSADSLIPQMFGQSWTSQSKETDAMWRIYSNYDKHSTDLSSLEETAVRIKVSIGDLFEIIYPKSSSFKNAYIGKVRYFDDNQFDNWLKDIQPLSEGHVGNFIVESFFIKREAFSHEEEVRIFINNTEANPPAHMELPIIKKSINIIDEILIDPRLKDAQVDYIKDDLTKNYSVSSSKLYQSKLYKFKPVPLIF